MLLKKEIKNLFLNEWAITFYLLIAFFLTHGYRYGWDDQHLEIPLLKSLIDPSLYPNDYYIESLRKNFSSFFYPLLAKLITVEQIPAAYFILFVISRYFLFYWIYKFWLHITNDKTIASLCTLTLLVISKIVEFFYQTFSHQEFALAMVLAGVYFFYKNRFILASTILGVAANFHALYALFPMAYLSAYLVFSYKQHGWKTLVKSLMSFGLCAAPIILWTIQRLILAPSPEDALPSNWLSITQTVTPEVFIFNNKPIELVFRSPFYFLIAAQEYIYFCLLYLFNCLFHEDFRKDTKNHCIVITAFALLLLNFISNYVIPNRFILTLLLTRNIQFLQFILIGYTALWFIRFIDREKPFWAFCAGLILPLMVSKDLIGITAIFIATFLIQIKSSIAYPSKLKRNTLFIIYSLLLAACLMIIVYILTQMRINILVNKMIWLRVLFLSAVYLLFFIPRLKDIAILKRLFILVPLVMYMTAYMQYHFHQLIKPKQGMELIQLDWEDMQKFVKANTPKDAMLLTPYDMLVGGFRIFSERPVVVCYRDCGIVNLDLHAVLEWQKRIQKIEIFKVKAEGNLLPAVIGAIKEYNVDYVVFSTYNAPTSNLLLELIYLNDSFALFKVNKDIPLPSL